MRGSRAALVIISAGLLTFAVVFTSLEFSPSAAAPVPVTPTEAPAPTPVPVFAVAADSLARRIDAGSLALGVPIAGSESLLRDVQPGDRLDIIASLASPQTGQPLTAVVVRGATALQSVSGSDPLLIEVPQEDAVMVAHLVLGGTHLSYVLWPANAAASDATAPPAVDDLAARAALGLAGATPTPAPAPVPTAVVVQIPAPAIQPGAPSATLGSGFLYQVQPGDTWDTIAATFGIAVGELRQWNEVPSDSQPVPGSLVFIPRES